MCIPIHSTPLHEDLDASLAFDRDPLEPRSDVLTDGERRPLATIGLQPDLATAREVLRNG